LIDYLRAGDVPAKPHTVFRGPGGALRYEECLTRRGFDGEFSILYHESHPTADLEIGPAAPGPWDRRVGTPAPESVLKRRLLLGASSPPGFTPALFNEDVALSFFRLLPAQNRDEGFANGDGDDLWYFFSGKATLETPFGDVAAGAGDYLLVPRGIVHRLVVDEEASGIVLELKGGFHLPSQFRNPVGQLRMDAPYTHRDFRRPLFRGPRPGPSSVLVKKGDRFVRRAPASSPFDVVGWDGTVWPFAFPINAFQPKTGQVHLPPTIHGTFASRGLLVCSFVPRVTDTHPDAIPCPYPHASVDCDELIYYVRGNFTSRRGVGPGAVSLHPAGISHGPHPGAYEASIGTRSTDELAVMVDTFAPLSVASESLPLEDPAYHDSWR
jgi:homogentisate 1,2-dioxygenase